MHTKPISWSNYCPKLPKLLTTRDLIQYHVNREAEMMIPDRINPIPHFTVEKQKKSVGWYNFFKSSVWAVMP